MRTFPFPRTAGPTHGNYLVVVRDHRYSWIRLTPSQECRSMAIQSTHPADSSSRLPSRLKKGRKSVWLLAGLGGAFLVLVGLVIYFWLFRPNAPFNDPPWTLRR